VISLSVCLLEYISGTTCPTLSNVHHMFNFIQCSVYGANGQGSILLRQQCSKLCTSRSVDDIMPRYTEIGDAKECSDSPWVKRI